MASPGTLPLLIPPPLPPTQCPSPNFGQISAPALPCPSQQQRAGGPGDTAGGPGDTAGGRLFPLSRTHGGLDRRTALLPSVRPAAGRFEVGLGLPPLLLLPPCSLPGAGSAPGDASHRPPSELERVPGPIPVPGAGGSSSAGVLVAWGETEGRTEGQRGGVRVTRGCCEHGDSASGSCVTDLCHQAAGTARPEPPNPSAPNPGPYLAPSCPQPRGRCCPAVGGTWGHRWPGGAAAGWPPAACPGPARCSCARSASGSPCAWRPRGRHSELGGPRGQPAGCPPAPSGSPHAASSPHPASATTPGGDRAAHQDAPQLQRRAPPLAG